MKLLVVAAALAATIHGQTALRLEDVLESVEKHYPPLAAALAERDIAGADVLAALGKFDLSLRGTAAADQLGFYRNERLYAGFEQPTQMWGSSFYGGWRLGDGSFAPYDGKLDTRSYGEWSGGFKLPLWRDRAIDSKRTDLRKAQLGIRLARLSIDQQRLVITQLATRRYWDWVAAGFRRQVAQVLLDTALARDQFLRDSAQLGQIAQIEVTENARAIVQRRSQVVEAERFLQQAAIELSLFYRDRSGAPVIAAVDQLPPQFSDITTLDSEQLTAGLDAARARRPELGRLSVQGEQLRLDARQAENERRPEIDFQLGFTAESGGGSVRRGPNELKGALIFELPFQRRSATGKLRSAEARLRQIGHRERFTEDQIVAEVRDAASAVRAAHDRVQLLRQEVRLARELEEAERSRFQLGDGSLFLVNLREQATADAANREIAAVNDYFRAQAQYDFAVAANVVPDRTASTTTPKPNP
jgi:outer membrane protein TolC